MLRSKHTLAHCKLCDTDMVRCGTCNNNCCNSTYGEVDGKVCPDCPEAYDHQAIFWKDPIKVRFAKDVRSSDAG
jgi:hypothetical protein